MTKKTPNPVDVAVGRKIRMQRTIIGMSQQTLGEKIGITFQQIQKYEKGTNRVGASRMQQIADVMGVSPSYFFDEPAQAGGGEPRDDAFLDFVMGKEGIALVRNFMNIRSAKMRRSVIALVEAAVEAEAAAEADGTTDAAPATARPAAAR